MIDGVERTPAAIIENPYEDPMKVFLPDDLEKKIKKNKEDIYNFGYRAPLKIANI
ncbi:MAG: hypothetical protein KBT88_13750 [Gammaproteobacteria bacterium]|nr:hypothetical protein [Gammaproteobacteria bacterium]MBQ0840844.1 hypothetical protein [Gammaproteobacteria bacterium]